jgi:hypothetical protein
MMNHFIILFHHNFREKNNYTNFLTITSIYTRELFKIKIKITSVILEGRFKKLKGSHQSNYIDLE